MGYHANEFETTRRRPIFPCDIANNAAFSLTTLSSTAQVDATMTRCDRCNSPRQLDDLEHLVVAVYGLVARIVYNIARDLPLVRPHTDAIF
jgi:hypothetical protein